MRDVGGVWYVWRVLHSPKLPYILQFLLRYVEDLKECQMLDRTNLLYSLKLNLNPISILFCNNKEYRIIKLNDIYIYHDNHLFDLCKNSYIIQWIQFTMGGPNADKAFKQYFLRKKMSFLWSFNLLNISYYFEQGWNLILTHSFV